MDLFQDVCSPQQVTLLCIVFQWQTMIAGIIALLGALVALWAAKLSISSEGRNRRKTEVSTLHCAMLTLQQHSQGLGNALNNVETRIGQLKGQQDGQQQSGSARYEALQTIYLPLLEAEIAESRQALAQVRDMVAGLHDSQEKAKVLDMIGEFGKTVTLCRYCANRVRYVADKQLLPFAELIEKMRNAMTMLDTLGKEP